MSGKRVSRAKLAGGIAAAITTAIIGAFASGAVSLPTATKIQSVSEEAHQYRLIQQHDTMILLMQHICLNTAPDASARRSCLNKHD